MLKMYHVCKLIVIEYIMRNTVERKHYFKRTLAIDEWKSIIINNIKIKF